MAEREEGETMMQIGKHIIDENHPCFIVAEISCNHLQKKELALQLIEEAKKAGADAVKFQTYTPHTMTLDVSNEPKDIQERFKIKGTLWDGKMLYDLYKEAYTPWEWFHDLQKKAKEVGLEFFSSPFDETAVDMLEKLNVPCYKIASFEINHIPLIKYIASKGKPVILSTGVADEKMIREAIRAIKLEGNDQIILLKCTSAYPAPISEANLRTMMDMQYEFDVEVGLSDHTTSPFLPAYAIAMDARIVEKHFTIEKEGPDAAFSLNPKEFSEMVKNVRECEAAMGKVSYELSEGALKHQFIMRSIFVKKAIKKGEIFTKDNLQIVRPMGGMPPFKWEFVLGRAAKCDIRRGEPLSKEDVGE